MQNTSVEALLGAETLQHVKSSHNEDFEISSRSHQNTPPQNTWGSKYHLLVPFAL